MGINMPKDKRGGKGAGILMNGIPSKILANKMPVVDVNKANNNYSKIGTLPYIDIIKKSFPELNDTEVILTDKQREHIKERRGDDFEFIMEKLQSTVENPDDILRDKKPNTVNLVKQFGSSYIEAVVRLSVGNEENGKKHSVITSIKLGRKNATKLFKNNPSLLTQER